MIAPLAGALAAGPVPEERHGVVGGTLPSGSIAGMLLAPVNAATVLVTPFPGRQVRSRLNTAYLTCAYGRPVDRFRRRSPDSSGNTDPGRRSRSRPPGSPVPQDG
ncbi:hypothetical protein ABZ471_10675 [Streptomyces sp. NPDC005728]|uniref:hypothetical protein n=1 Tax=Streptomyces sp. NPDC005728 TaxID=3157054 RepID=UPI0033D1A5FF